MEWLNEEDPLSRVMMQVIAMRAINLRVERLHEDLANRIINKLGKMLSK